VVSSATCWTVKRLLGVQGQGSSKPQQLRGRAYAHAHAHAHAHIRARTLVPARDPERTLPGPCARADTRAQSCTCAAKPSESSSAGPERRC
jgi:hypothetical protein